jgi:hypothetical protein
MSISAIVTEYWPLAIIVLGAILAVLKFVAPKTKTLKDDRAAEILEDIVEFASAKKEDEK